MKQIKTLQELGVKTKMSNDGRLYIANEDKLEYCTLEELFNAIAFNIGWRFDTSKIYRPVILPVVQYAGKMRLYDGAVEIGDVQINITDVERLSEKLPLDILPYSDYCREEELTTEELRIIEEEKEKDRYEFLEGPTVLRFYNLDGKVVFEADLFKQAYNTYTWIPKRIKASIGDVSGMLPMIRSLISHIDIEYPINDDYFGDLEPSYMR